MKKLITIIICISICCLISLNAFGADPARAGMKELDEVYNEDYNDNKYITKYKDNYSLDVDAGTFDVVEKAMNYATNVLFSFQKIIVELSIYLIDKALNFSTYNIMDTVLEKFIKNMYTSLFKVLSGILLSCLGFYFFVQMLKRRQVEFWTGLVKTIFILALAFLYFGNPLILARNVEKASTSLTKEIVSKSNKDIIANGRDSNITTIIANSLWNEYVHKAWRLLEFGDNKVADEWQDKILALSYGSEEREDIIKQYEKETKNSTKAMVGKRLAFMLVYIIPMLVNLLLIALLCLGIVVIQFLTTFIFVLGIFVFILALIPSFGTTTLKKWGVNILVLVSFKLILAFTLMFMMAFNNTLYDIAGEEGWIFSIILQMAIYISIYLFRHKIIEIFAMTKEVIKDPHKAINRFKHHDGDINPYSTYGYKRTPKGERISDSRFSKKNISGYIKKTKDDYRNAYESRKRDISEKGNQYQREQYINKQKAGYKDKVETEKAEKYLNKKYNFKKKKVAKMPPTKYSKDVDYVNKVDKRKANGKKPYSEDEIKRVKERRSKAKEYIEKRSKRNDYKPYEYKNKKVEKVKKVADVADFENTMQFRAKDIKKYQKIIKKEKKRPLGSKMRRRNKDE